MPGVSYSDHPLGFLMFSGNQNSIRKIIICRNKGHGNAILSNRFWSARKGHLRRYIVSRLSANIMRADLRHHTLNFNRTAGLSFLEFIRIVDIQIFLSNKYHDKPIALRVTSG